MLQVRILAWQDDSAAEGSTTAEYCRVTIESVLDLDFPCPFVLGPAPL